MKGVLDRIEDNKHAVILIEELNDEWIIPAEELPQGSEVNTWFTLQKQQGRYHIIDIDHELTKQKAEKTSDLMAKLRARKKRWD